MFTVAVRSVSLVTWMLVTVTPLPRLTVGVVAVKCVPLPVMVTCKPLWFWRPLFGATELRNAGPALTVKRLSPVTVTPAVVAVTLRVVRAARGEIVIVTSASTALITVCELTVTPGPKLKTVAAVKFVIAPITLTTPVELCGRDAGFTNWRTPTVCCTVKAFSIVATSPCVLSVTLRKPGTAPPSTLTATVADVGDVTCTPLIVMP